MNAHAIVVASAQAARLGQVRDGVVVAVDPTTHSVKVRVEPDGQETGWIPDAAVASGGLRISCPCEEGTQVKIMPTAGDIEHAVIVARIFDVQVTPPVSPQTGKPAQPGEMLAMAGQGAAPVTDGGSVGAVTSGAGWFHVAAAGFFAGAGNARLAVQDGLITLTIGAATYTFTATALAAMGAKITSDQDVLAAGISGKSHVHGGVETGAGDTGLPV